MKKSVHVVDLDVPFKSTVIVAKLITTPISAGSDCNVGETLRPKVTEKEKVVNTKT